MGVRVVRVSSKSLHHERRGGLHAVQKARVHHARHLRLEHVLRALDLLVRKVAERRKVVPAHRLRDADRRVAETVADGNVRLLVTRVQDLLRRDAVHNSVQVSCNPSTLL